MAAGCGLTRLQQLVGDPGEGADYNHWSRVQPAPNDIDHAPESRSILHRSAAELHHYHVIASIESALSLWPIHFDPPCSIECFRAKKNPPPDRFWRWVREIFLRLLTSSDPVLQKTRNSCRHSCVCRCNSCDAL